jgi:hypothetical protein
LNACQFCWNISREQGTGNNPATPLILFKWGRSIRENCRCCSLTQGEIYLLNCREEGQKL